MIRYDRTTPWQQPGPYRLADYFRYDGDDRCELLYGRFVMSPGPSNRHQILVGLAFEVLAAAARKNGGRTLMAPADVVLADDTVVQPDVFYVRRENVGIVTAQETHGSPDIVVEVLSPGTRRRDRIEKLVRYAAAGVPEYWILDPDSRVAQFMVLDGANYRVVVPHEDRYHSACPGVELDVAALWASFRPMAPDNA